MGYIAGIGAANVDIRGRSDGRLIMGDSNPGMLYTALGGVCRNICENLARLGSDVKLVTVVGGDESGRSILRGCEAAGIDMSHTSVLEDERSSGYMSILDEKGDKVLAMSDVRIARRMDGAFVDQASVVLSNADIVVCDGNLPRDTVSRLTEVCLAPLYLDPASAACAKELAPLIGYFDTVKPNRMELAALAGCATDTLGGMLKACDILLRKGVRRVFVSLGREGMLYRGREGTVHRIARPFPDVVDVTSAGEAAMAGIVWGSRQGMTADEIVCVAMAAGMIATSSPETISADMSVAKIEEIIRDFIA